MLRLIELLIIVFLFISCGGSKKTSLAGDHKTQKIPQESKDPESEFFGIHSTQGWFVQPIQYSLSVNMTQEQQDGLKFAIETWEAAIGKPVLQFMQFVPDDEKKFLKISDSLGDDINGFYINFDWARFGRSSAILATTVWTQNQNDGRYIDKADIHFNGENFLLVNTLQKRIDSLSPDNIVDMESLALHELGHLMGLTHVEESVDPMSIMNPSLYIGPGMTRRSLSKGDILRIQKIYSCEGEVCDIEKAMELLKERNKRTRDEEILFYSSDNS
jgi:hypothetical protein